MAPRERARVARPPRGSGADRAVRAPEWELAAQALLALAVLAVPVVGLGMVVAGASGAVSAVMGLTLVAGLFAFSALLTAAAARVGSQTALTVTAGAVTLRVGVYVGALLAMTSVDGLHVASLAGATLVALAVTVGYEIRYMASHPQLVWLRV